MKKKHLCVLLCVALVVAAMAGCSGQETTSDTSTTAETTASDAENTDSEEASTEKPVPGEGVPEHLNIGLGNIHERAAFGKLVKMGFEEATAARGWTLTYADNNADGATAVANAEILANAGCDFVVELSQDETVGETIVDIFEEADIPVLAVDIPLADAPFFGVNSPKMGYMNGEYAAAYIKEHWDNQVDYVVLMTQIASGDTVNERCRSAVDALEDAGVEIGEVVEIEPQGDTAIAQSMFASFLTAHPDSHKIAIFTINENPATGAMAAAETADRLWDIRIFSVGVGDQFVTPMYESQGNQPWISSNAAFAETYGEQVCTLIENYYETGVLEQQNDGFLAIIDWSNIQEYYPEGEYPWLKVQ